MQKENDLNNFGWMVAKINNDIIIIYHSILQIFLYAEFKNLFLIGLDRNNNLLNWVD